jgi:hypothetical protein
MKNIGLPVLAGLLAAGCSSGPPAPAKGTPAFYWSAARENFAKSDWLKTADNLAAVAKSSNEYTKPAIAWNLALTAGLASGYAELADAFEIGGRVNKANPGPFRKQMNDYRTLASRAALSLAEQMGRMKELEGEKIPLDFPFPAGTVAPSPVIGKVQTGILPAAGEAEAAEKKTLEKNILEALSAAAGAADAAKAREMMKAGAIEVPAAVYKMAIARGLATAAGQYAATKLDQPDKLKALAEMAQNLMKGAPESKETKELNDKIAGLLKKKAA